MPRVKGGTVARKRRKKILKLAKGYVGSRSLLYRTAHEQVMKSLAYAYRDRKQRKREFRKLWIQRINAATKQLNFKYSLLIHGLALANVQVNRKMLADIAVSNPEDFKLYVEIAQEAIKGNLPKVAKVKAVEVKVTKAEVIVPIDKVESKKDTPKKDSTTPLAVTKKAAPKKETTTPVAAPKKVAATKSAAPKKETTTPVVAPKTTTVKKTTAKKEA
jgi:large subunit ribosomal protein L20